MVRFENVGLRYGLGPEVLSDLTFRILPSEAPDGSILWVDEYGDAMPLFQCAGEGIEQYELTHEHLKHPAGY